MLKIRTPSLSRRDDRRCRLAIIANQDGTPLRAVRVRRAKGVMEVRALIVDGFRRPHVIDAFVLGVVVLSHSKLRPLHSQAHGHLTSRLRMYTAEPL